MAKYKGEHVHTITTEDVNSVQGLKWAGALVKIFECDIGKQIYKYKNTLGIESSEQMTKRLGRTEEEG